MEGLCKTDSSKSAVGNGHQAENAQWAHQEFQHSGAQTG